MKTLKKGIRIFILSLVIILAAAGAGMLGAFLPNTRERYMDKEIRIEQVDRKTDDEQENNVDKD